MVAGRWTGGEREKGRGGMQEPGEEAGQKEQEGHTACESEAGSWPETSERRFGVGISGRV